MESDSHYATIRAWARRISIHALRMESDLFQLLGLERHF